MSGLFPLAPGDAIRAGRRDGVRHLLDQAGWARLTALASTAPPASLLLLGLWAEAGGQVHALFLEQQSRPLVASVETEAGRYLALSGGCAQAVPYERRIRDLFGFEAMHAADLRALLDHGNWTATAPLAARPGPPPRGREPPEWAFASDGWFDPRAGAHLERGPVGAWRDPGPRRERLTLDGPDVARLEWRVGYGHRGIAALIRGRPPNEAVALVSRIDALSACAHATALSRAIEQALGVELPGRAALLRDAAILLEHAASHLENLVEMARLGDAPLAAATAAGALARLRSILADAFGHRYGIGYVVPGGVSHDLDAGRLARVAESLPLLEAAGARIARLHGGWGGLASRLERLGVVAGEAAVSLGASGIVARACSGEDGPVAGRAAPGSAGARAWLRIGSPLRVAGRLRDVLDRLEDCAGAAIRAPVPARPDGRAAEGIGSAEAPEGELWNMVRLAPDRSVELWFGRDPSVPHLLLLERQRGFVAEDAGLLASSFGLSVGGLDQ